MRRTPRRIPGRPLVAAVAAAVMLGLLASAPHGPVAEAAAPVASSSAEPTATVFYYTKTRNWSAYKLHYAPDGGSWTTVPGMAMEAASTDWVKKAVDLGSATTMTAAFNNGSGVWDNNSGADYTLPAGLVTVKDGKVTAGTKSPCAAETPDTQAPTAPAGVRADADGVSVVLGWDTSTDDRGVTKYQVTRTGGTNGTLVTDVGSPVYSDTGLEARTAYSYTVRAVDAAGNVSAASAAVTATTGEKPATPAPGEPLGTDRARTRSTSCSPPASPTATPRTTAAAASTPSRATPPTTTRCSGATSRVLSTSSTTSRASACRPSGSPPVVLNRSDYDYHGYHGYDFYEVDSRPESAGASYQDLIDAAHAKGMFTPKTYGVRDTQWSWYYDERNEGFEYDGLTVETKSGKSYYNGDLWSTAEPSGNTCLDWGKPTQCTSPEGYRICNCQWPSPTSVTTCRTTAGSPV